MKIQQQGNTGIDLYYTPIDTVFVDQDEARKLLADLQRIVQDWDSNIAGDSPSEA